MSYNPGQCTYWAQHMAATEGWAIPETWGDAHSWLDSARRDGITVSASPAIGAVAVWAPNTGGAGSYGHVAYVTACSGALISISEENWPEGSGPSTRTIPAANCAGFILPPRGKAMTRDERLEMCRGFVRMQYVAVLHREPLPENLEFWSNRMAVAGVDSVLAEMNDTQGEAIADRLADFTRDHPPTP